jgi:hypothetical protein
MRENCPNLGGDQHGFSALAFKPSRKWAKSVNLVGWAESSRPTERLQ